ncbi:hypothetical protein GCM10007874_10620 [Labrys miyagiensis]|uniref:Uncharacterized protein n=1 Tax=Labrys miyagiensis TaxID=346912 RepID=A0ABQ6CCR3_9HYPH|nr:hypothetical protein [Labrys miyagiensis]GLS18046.1 hypothetical protein GCM10007874_10620 [Labrys miyagiensis]
MSTDESKKRRLNEYRRAWSERLLGELVNTFAHLPKDDHARVTELARENKLRVPTMIARLVRIGLDVVDDHVPATALAPPSPPPPHIDLPLLARAILRSRFPGDTGNARFQQLAFLNVVASEALQGRGATQTSIAKFVEAQRSAVGLIGQKLIARGVVQTQLTPGANGARSGKSYVIKADAVEALCRAQMQTTGERLDMSENPPSPGSAPAGVPATDVKALP